jgi:acyl-CoA synthetase (AMP-forming)/AMP-acid ligase II
MRVVLPETEHLCESLIDLVQYRATTQPEAIAYRFLSDESDEVQTITYRVLSDQARAIAATLQQQNVLPGQRVILIYPPGVVQKLKQLKLLKQITRTLLIKHAAKRSWSKGMALMEWDLETLPWLATDKIYMSGLAKPKQRYRLC